ncbi:hypothetical protein AGOR_G00046480 [Albula goreensis]|uniref:Proepiregulin n=1 Tax=Albula goreensis TaxID=1534307 RepID=A0A8T3DSJ3_9TELE|nr:hypothetical protein AGOR_G00046480 [Albula goreensis]
MAGLKPYFFLAICGVPLLWSGGAESTNPDPTCGSDRCSTSGAVSAVPMVTTPRVERVMIQKCNSSMEDYCFHGECMYLLDLNEHHCKCERGYAGHRCAHLALVIQPLSQESVILTVVCVSLTALGIAGAAYFTYRWYKRNSSPPVQKEYQEVQMV